MERIRKSEGQLRFEDEVRESRLRTVEMPGRRNRGRPHREGFRWSDRGHKNR